MKLEHIEQKECPICGAIVIEEVKSNQHASGDWFESRMFECGRKVSYVPGLKSIEIEYPCPKDPSILKQTKKRKAARIKLENYTRKLDVDKKFKEKLTRELGNYCYR